VRRGRIAGRAKKVAGAEIGVRLVLLVILLCLSLPATASAESVHSCGTVTVRSDAASGNLARSAARIACAPHGFPGFPAGARLEDATIHLTADPAHFRALTGGRTPDWGAGVAIPAERLIVIPTFRLDGGPAGGASPGIVTLRHEIAHLALRQEVPGTIPRWFDEGYATWVSGGLDERAGWQLRLAFLLGRAPPLDSITLSWPAEAERARLSYLLSATAVRHMAERSGPGGMEALFRNWREVGRLDPAVRRTFGITLGQFEREWQRVVQRRYGWLLMVSHIGAVWTALALALAVLFIFRRRRFRRRIGVLEEREEAEEAYLRERSEGTAPLLDDPGTRG